MKELITDHSDPTKSFERNYVYDQQEILAEHDESKVLGIYTHSMLRTDDVLAVDVKDTKLATNIQSYFYLKNAIGTITEVVDSSGSLIQHYVYSSFGKILKIVDNNLQDITASPILKTSYGFTNREHDEETGLMYYRARFMIPEIGRFMQEDPHPGKMSLPRSVVNKYVYALNNPLQYTDPTGEFIFTAAALVYTLATVGLSGLAVAAKYALVAGLITASFSAIGTAGAGGDLSAVGSSFFGGFVQGFGYTLTSVATGGFSTLGFFAASAAFAFDGTVASTIIEGGSLESAEFGERVGFAVAFSPLSGLGLNAADKAAGAGASKAFQKFVSNGYGALATLGSSGTAQTYGTIRSRINDLEERTPYHE